MMFETISDLLRYLSAPRHNTVWSWGSVRKWDGAVFLLVWADEVKKKQDGKLYTQILGPWGDGAGFRERVGHVELIKKGAPANLIFCTAMDTKANPRSIASFNKEFLFIGGEVHADGEFTWIENKVRITIREALLK